MRTVPMTAHGDVLEPARVRYTADDGRPGWSPAEVAARAMRVAWAWPALLTFVAGCYQLTRPELWRDELSSWSFATRPVPQLVDIVGHSNASQLLYYLLLHYWIAAFGDSAAAMRLLSVLAMSGAAACVTLVGRRLAGARAGLLAGLVFALVPSISRFAQETRFYAFEVLVAMLATLLLLRAVESPAPRRWVAYALCVAVLGYVDLVALCLLAAHAIAVAMRWWHERDYRLACFLPAGLAGCLACAPMAIVGLGQAGSQVGWLPRPGLSLSAFAFFGRNLFYSTGAAAALVIVAVLAWAVASRAAAFATSLAIAPVAVVWVVSQGAVSYFFPRYLLFTVGAWAILAGIALSKLDIKVAAAAVIVFGILGAGDQQAIRQPGSHNWASYPVSENTRFWDYAGAAQIVADGVRPGDGIAYPANPVRWKMIDYGVEYYLSRDLPAARMPRQVFVARSAAAAGTLYSILCAHPVRCLDDAPRVWVVGSGNTRNPWRDLPANEVAALKPLYRVTRIRHVNGLSIFLLTRT
jgi:mannosyltransferase